MSATGGKYGAVTAEKKQFHPGEPVFLLRATDPLAPEAVMAYARQCIAAGCSNEHCSAALDHASRIALWQKLHPELVKKLPD